MVALDCPHSLTPFTSTPPTAINRARPCSPAFSFAWVPGSTGCLRCTHGVPTCQHGYDSGSSCTPTDYFNPGYTYPYHRVLEVEQMASCALTGDFAMPMYQTCASWKLSSPTLKLSVSVSQVRVEHVLLLCWCASPAQPSCILAWICRNALSPFHPSLTRHVPTGTPMTTTIIL